MRVSFDVAAKQRSPYSASHYRYSRAALTPTRSGAYLDFGRIYWCSHGGLKARFYAIEPAPARADAPPGNAPG
jgi:hypothetical protein